MVTAGHIPCHGWENVNTTGHFRGFNNSNTAELMMRRAKRMKASTKKNTGKLLIDNHGHNQTVDKVLSKSDTGVLLPYVSYDAAVNRFYNDSIYPITV